METPLDDVDPETEKKKTLQDYIDAARRDEMDRTGSLLSRRKMMGLSREAARTAISQGPPSGDDAVAEQLGQRLDRHKEKLKELSRQATGKQMAGLEETPDERADDL
ncbi:MAG: hypothetical protein R6U10_02670 [Thermoplasmatota archaeon]